MGWFDEQIRQRKESDQQIFEEAFFELSDSVTGKNESSAFMGDADRAKDAIALIATSTNSSNSLCARTG